MQTTTGHIITIDTDTMRLAVSGDLDTMDAIPAAEYDAAAAEYGLVVDWARGPIDETTLALREVAPVSAHDDAAAMDISAAREGEGMAPATIEAMVRGIMEWLPWEAEWTDEERAALEDVVRQALRDGAIQSHIYEPGGRALIVAEVRAILDEAADEHAANTAPAEVTP